MITWFSGGTEGRLYNRRFSSENKGGAIKNLTANQLPMRGKKKMFQSLLGRSDNFHRETTKILLAPSSPAD